MFDFYCSVTGSPVPLIRLSNGYKKDSKEYLYDLRPVFLIGNPTILYEYGKKRIVKVVFVQDKNQPSKPQMIAADLLKRISIFFNKLSSFVFLQTTTFEAKKLF